MGRTRVLRKVRRLRIGNPRYSAARPSPNQYDPTTDEHGWTRIRETPSPSVLIRVHPWLNKTSRAATISGDTDRLEVCATSGRRCRSAGFQPAVSPTSSRQSVDQTRGVGRARCPRIGNPRYSVGRRSRKQTLPLLRAAEERAGERRCPSPRSSPHSCVVGRGRSKAPAKNLSRLATISGDADRLEVCAALDTHANPRFASVRVAAPASWQGLRLPLLRSPFIRGSIVAIAAAPLRLSAPARPALGCCDAPHNGPGCRPGTIPGVPPGPAAPLRADVSVLPPPIP
jgi:hypothetical protein